ncbi:telomere silencing zds1 [Pyrenophora seminiperda CCB06]|uniref:Telomere silencing zds1 n=1 Tax=Pyrenophora seminiperda CCB06 TaxID=1302712 RepID=A0A3M7M1E1_9PLEO|nr:telomere silencing zds1 [Pyrenophora seminiperda CCB06]
MVNCSPGLGLGWGCLTAALSAAISRHNRPAPPATDRAQELDRLYQMRHPPRRGHAPHISISDESHHSNRRSLRPLSFVPSPNGDLIQSLGAFEAFDPFPNAPPARSPLRPQMSSGTTTSPPGPNGTAAMQQNSAQMSPPLSRSNSDTASHQFPLNQLDYESSPAGLAQELSNLQAIRRMSMGVNNADPDLPSFKSANSPPSPPAMSEEDESKLFWVPARLHPELAPMEFKTFIEDKIDRTRRRSGDAEALSPEGVGRQSSNAGLRRKKSMLSRQIDTGSGYKDGAERLERKRSGTQSSGGLTNLQELEHIQEDPVALIRRMSIDQKDFDGEGGVDGDLPIVPGSKMGGLGTLKRSTRTTYRRGSLRKGGPPLSRRLAAGRQAETDTEDSPSSSPVYSTESIPDVPPLPLARVQSEPVNSAFEHEPSNFSRPKTRRSPTSVTTDRPGSAEEPPRPASTEPVSQEKSGPQPRKFHSRIASNGRTTAPLPGYNPQQQQQQQQVPQIIQTPPPQEKDRRPPHMLLPERNSSRQPPPQSQQQQPQPAGPRSYPQSQPPPPSQQRQPSSNRPNRHVQAAQSSPIKPAQSFDDLVGHSSPMPGMNNRVDSLSIIPNAPEEKRLEPQKSDKKAKDKESEGGPRKTSWGWFSGDKEKEKDKKVKDEKEKEGGSKKVKNKLSKSQEKNVVHDDTRLDLLQTSIQGSGRGRESVVLDRESVKLEEERKKESARKTSSDGGKKEKEPGLLSSIFGGKKKGEKESAHKKNASRGLSPEPPPRILKPDIDYNWTRFSILEERAIYRMAHIKLANPRRELYSQVLLSNFMYSYLAKVQQMHPQISIGNSKQAKQAQQAQQQQQAAQQKKEQQLQQQQQPQQQQQQQQPQQSQPDEFAQYQRYQQAGKAGGYQNYASDEGGEDRRADDDMW